MTRLEQIGHRILKARVHADLSQSELGKHIGATPPAISQWENGHRKPNATHLRRLSQALGVTTDWLLGLDG